MIHKFTSQQKFQPEQRGQCCESEVSPRYVAASSPSVWWKWRPASPAPLRAPTLTGCHWVHLLCPPNVWNRRGEFIYCKTEGKRQKQRGKETKKESKCFLKYVLFIAAQRSQGIPVKSQCCPSNNITSYVTWKYPRPLETPWCRIHIQLSNIILHSFPVVLTCYRDQEQSLLVSTLWAKYMVLWQRKSVRITLIIMVLHGFSTA